MAHVLAGRPSHLWHTEWMICADCPGAADRRPLGGQEMARQRDHQLRTSAGRYGQLESRRKRHGPVRYRAGWVLIEIGFALTRGSGGDRHRPAWRRYRAGRDARAGSAARTSAKDALQGAAMNQLNTVGHQVWHVEELALLDHPQVPPVSVVPAPHDGA